jgi:hypothetical protein
VWSPRSTLSVTPRLEPRRHIRQKRRARAGPRLVPVLSETVAFSRGRLEECLRDALLPFSKHVDRERPARDDRAVIWLVFWIAIMTSGGWNEHCEIQVSVDPTPVPSDPTAVITCRPYGSFRRIVRLASSTVHPLLVLSPPFSPGHGDSIDAMARVRASRVVIVGGGASAA